MGVFRILMRNVGLLFLSRKNSNYFSSRTKNRTIFVILENITVNGEERNLDYLVLQSLAQNSANSFHAHPPDTCTFLLFSHKASFLNLSSLSCLFLLHADFMNLEMKIVLLELRL
jgi:hypothetical protein